MTAQVMRWPLRRSLLFLFQALPDEETLTDGKKSGPTICRLFIRLSVAHLQEWLIEKLGPPKGSKSYLTFSSAAKQFKIHFVLFLWQIEKLGPAQISYKWSFEVLLFAPKSPRRFRRQAVEFLGAENKPRGFINIWVLIYICEMSDEVPLLMQCMTLYSSVKYKKISVMQQRKQVLRKNPAHKTWLSSLLGINNGLEAKVSIISPAEIDHW